MAIVRHADAAERAILVPVVAPVVEEIDRMGAVVAVRREVQMCGGDVAVKVSPPDEVTGPLLGFVQGDPGEAVPAAVPSAGDLPGDQPDGEITVPMRPPVVVRSRGARQGGDEEDRREKREARSDTSQHHELFPSAVPRGRT